MKKYIVFLFILFSFFVVSPAMADERLDEEPETISIFTLDVAEFETLINTLLPSSVPQATFDISSSEISFPIVKTNTYYSFIQGLSIRLTVDPSNEQIRSIYLSYASPLFADHNNDATYAIFQTYCTTLLKMYDSSLDKTTIESFLPNQNSQDTLTKNYKGLLINADATHFEIFQSNNITVETEWQNETKGLPIFDLKVPEFEALFNATLPAPFPIAFFPFPNGEDNSPRVSPYVTPPLEELISI